MEADRGIAGNGAGGAGPRSAETCRWSRDPHLLESVEELEADYLEAAEGTIVLNEVPEESAAVHVVLLGDSTLDNGRYLDYRKGELSVEKQLSRRCEERGWAMTALAQDGSMLDDVLRRQVPLIPSTATHLVLSASGNDLLALLNSMVLANFSLRSMYEAIGNGLKEVAAHYRNLLQLLQSQGCHVACCTVYRPNFAHLFFRSLAALSLGMHNSRLQQISVDLDCSVIDLASMFDGAADFANPLELSTHGGAKVVENITAFVCDHPVMSMRRYRSSAGNVAVDDDILSPMANVFGVPMRCCATRAGQRRVYSITEVNKVLEEPDVQHAQAAGQRLVFSEEQQRWRET